MALQNVWLISSFALLLVWLVIFLLNKKTRKEMLFASFLTAPLGFTEPLFVPEYWSPPSLFNLALKTGFDIESFIFAFAIGGIAAILYEIFISSKHKKMSKHEMRNPRHKYHALAVLSPLILFVILILLTNLNPIYIAIISMFTGGIFTILCRPDLNKRVWISGILFTVLYFVFFLLLLSLYPDFIKSWNIQAISGILITGVPLEEILFAFTLGMLWGSIYEHIIWQK